MTGTIEIKYRYKTGAQGTMRFYSDNVDADIESLKSDGYTIISWKFADIVITRGFNPV